MDAIADRRVIVEKKHLERIGVRIDEDLFTIVLEGPSTGLPWISKNAVGYFETVDVGLILLEAAKAVAHSAGDKTKESE